MENINKCCLQMILLIFTNYNLKDFKNVIKREFESLNKWFKANPLSLEPHGLRRRCPAAWLLELCVVSNRVEVAALGSSLVQRSTTNCVVPECDRKASIERGPGPTMVVCAIKINSHPFACSSLLQPQGNGLFYEGSCPPIIL